MSLTLPDHTGIESIITFMVANAATPKHLSKNRDCSASAASASAVSNGEALYPSSATRPTKLMGPRTHRRPTPAPPPPHNTPPATPPALLTYQHIPLHRT